MRLTIPLDKELATVAEFWGTGGTDQFSQSIAINKIKNKIVTALNSLFAFHEKKDSLDQVKKSIVYYVMTDIVFLKENLKNAYDARSKTLNLFININFDANDLTCAFIDNGNGFTEYFNKKEIRRNARNSSGFADYRKILDPLFVEGAEIKLESKLGSDKKAGIEDEKKHVVIGGAGLGLRSMAILLHQFGQGKLEIGNIENLLSSPDYQTKCGIENSELLPRKGGVLIYSAPLFSQIMYEHSIRNISGNDVESHAARYARYIKEEWGPEEKKAEKKKGKKKFTLPKDKPTGVNFRAAPSESEPPFPSNSFSSPSSSSPEPEMEEFELKLPKFTSSSGAALSISIPESEPPSSSSGEPSSPSGPSPDLIVAPDFLNSSSSSSSSTSSPESFFTKKRVRPEPTVETDEKNMDDKKLKNRKKGNPTE